MIQWIKPSLSVCESSAAFTTVKSGWITQGKLVEKFEDALCEYIGCKYAVCVNSGTSALLLSMLCLLEKYMCNNPVSNLDYIRVYLPSTSFIASLYPAYSIGLRTYSFIDVCSDSLLMNDALLLEAYNKASHAENTLLIPVHLSGNVFESSYADKFDFVIEDACQALGSKYKNGKMVGNSKNLCCFSFHVGKIITTGEGGCVTTNDIDMYEMLVQIRNHGLSKNYNTSCFGLNFRMTDLAASIGLQQLKKIDKFISRRRLIADCYKANIDDRDIFLKKDVNRHIYSFMPVRLSQPSYFRDVLSKEHAIDCRLFFPPLYEHAIFKRNKSLRKIHAEDENNNPIASSLRDHLLLLPMGNGHSLREIEEVSSSINELRRRLNG